MDSGEGDSSPHSARGGRTAASLPLRKRLPRLTRFGLALMTVTACVLSGAGIFMSSLPAKRGAAPVQVPAPHSPSVEARGSTQEAGGRDTPATLTPMPPEVQEQSARGRIKENLIGIAHTVVFVSLLVSSALLFYAGAQRRDRAALLIAGVFTTAFGLFAVAALYAADALAVLLLPESEAAPTAKYITLLGIFSSALLTAIGVNIFTHGLLLTDDSEQHVQLRKLHDELREVRRDVRALARTALRREMRAKARFRAQRRAGRRAAARRVRPS